ncbi:uncharacterized protein [Atheta coriaria]|uniref:uncharacterized protein n=1 Tax=Dalotia coriaria TaxID=877792 RepID=UPI0031F41550
MDSFTSEQYEDAQEFASFYFDLLENHRETFTYHLSEGAVLDWFGRTIKGVQNIKDFAKLHMDLMKHRFSKIEPCHEIGYRKTHIVEYSTLRATDANDVSEVKPNPSAQQEKTPPNATIATSSRKREKGQGDGLHNCPSESPAKRSRLTGDVIEPKISAPLYTANISSTGYLEFRGKSGKKYQKETKWQRPCTFQVAYSKTPTGYLVHLIIYKGNMRCRRNLLNDFNAVPNPAE